MAEIKRGSPGLEKAGLAVYGIMCLIVFTFIRFPYDTFRGKLEQAIGSAINQQVTLGHIHFRLPIGFRVDSLMINRNLLTKELILMPHLFSLLGGKYGLDMKAVFPTGSLKCSFDVPMGESGKPMNLLLKMDNFDAGLFKVIFSTRSQARGIINGTIDLEGPGMTWSKMGGQVDLEWKDGNIPLPGFHMPMEEIRFKSMEMDSTLNKGVMSLNKMDITGDVSGSMKGSVHLSNQLSQSRMNITGNISLPQGAVASPGTGQASMPQGNVRFSLKGTFNTPRFRIAGPSR